jgi:hypothetical protein
MSKSAAPGAIDQGDQGLREAVQRQDEVGATGGDRGGGHALSTAGLGVLSGHPAAAAFDRRYTAGTVEEPAGEYGGDQAGRTRRPRRRAGCPQTGSARCRSGSTSGRRRGWPNGGKDDGDPGTGVEPHAGAGLAVGDELTQNAILAALGDDELDRLRP